MRDRFLLLAIAAFAIGVALRSLYPVPWPVIAFFVLLAACSAFWYRIPQVLMVSVLFASLSLGMGRVALAPSTAPELFLPLFNTDITFTGIVQGDPDLRETTQRVTMGVEHGGAHMHLLAVLPLYPRLAHGDRVEITGKLEYPEPFDTEGGRVFRYDRFLAKDATFGVIERATVEKIDGPESVAQLRGLLYTIKHRFMDGLAQALPEPYAALAGGIIAGGKQGLGKELLNAFTTAGLIHIVVLSGYNVMIIAEAVLRAFGFLRRRTASVLALLTIGAFVLAAGAGTASIRAGIMAGLALFARASGRTYDALRALLFVFALMLCINPLLLVYDPGFQFSFAATAGLILGAPLIEDRLTRIRSGFLRDLLATTLAAQLFVLPLLLYQTGNLSLVALPANVLALPVVPLAMLLSAIAGAAGVLVPFAAPIIGLPALVTLWYLIGIAQVAASLPFASIIVPAFPFIVVVILYLLLALGGYRLTKNTPA